MEINNIQQLLTTYNSRKCEGEVILCTSKVIEVLGY